ncbi:MAG TPA: hypothetical protein VMA53_00915 [Stellaceae bacterium]|nr:hypothetical protein [Stellaceae bacterium]
MTGHTLAKAARLQERIRAAVRLLPLAPCAVIGIFAPEPAAAVEREAARLRKDLDVLARLLKILAQVRAATGRANAECGIGDLLAEKAGLAEELSLLSKLVPERAGTGSAGDLDGMLGRAQRPSLRRHAGEVEAQVSAMRARYEQAQRSETTIDAPLLDDADAERLRERIVACRRRLEEIGDRLRELNSGVRVEIDDVALAYLREEEVI